MMVRSFVRAAVGVFCTLGAVGGCKGRGSGEAVGEIAQTWTPPKPASALDVPLTAVTTAITARLAEKPPAPVGSDVWAHAKKLYKTYNSTPLWLTENGIDKPRAGALMLALADGTTDGMRLEDFPLTALGAAIDSVGDDKKPTAEQLANVDVMLTATYVALGEGLMT